MNRALLTRLLAVASSLGALRFAPEITEKIAIA
jgi:hypothetical protein